MHEGALLRKLHCQNRLHAGVDFAQRLRQIGHCCFVRTLGEADNQQIFTGHEQVAALQCRHVSFQNPFSRSGHEVDSESAFIAKRGVMFEDILGEERLAAPGLCGHAAKNHAAAEDDLGVTGEEIVRHWHEIERGQRTRSIALLRNAADQHFGQRRGRLLPKTTLQPTAEFVSLGKIAKHFALDLIVFKDFFQQVLDVIDLAGYESEELLKAAMLFTSDLAVKNVIEK